MATTAAVATTAGARSTTASASAPSVYWANYTGNTLSYANLNGNGGGTLDTAGGIVNHPQGFVLDSAGDRMFWPNYCAGCALSWSTLAGTYGGQVPTYAATVSDPSGLAGADWANSGSFYWANFLANKISWMHVSSGTGGDFDTTGATVNKPTGVALDVVHQRLYWSNYGDNAHPISWVSLVGGGAGNLAISGATADGATSLALDLTSNKVYWTNSPNNTISVANLSGGGGSQLNTTGATVAAPQGIAIDHAGGKIYWANYGGNKISSANLAGGGGADLNTTGTTVSGPNFVALLEPPANSVRPTISGVASPGQTLTCATGTWADDTGAFLAEAPSSYAYHWSRDGVDNGSTAATYQAQTGDAGHLLRCRVTGSNRVGSTDATSDPARIYAADGSGMLTTPTAWVPNASTGNTVSLSYRAATGGTSSGAVRVAVPAGWSPPSKTASAPGYTTSGSGAVSVSGQTITVSGLTLAAGATVSIRYGATSGGGPGATSPGTAGTQTWQAKERSTAAGSFAQLAGSPAITVLSPDGAGKILTPTTSVTHSSSHHTITFTYTAATGGISGGAVTLAVPSGWSAPSTTGSAPGYATANHGALTVSSRTITVSGLTLAKGQTVVVTYGSKAGGGAGATAPATAGAQSWQARGRSSAAGALTKLAASPSITVS